MGDKLYCGAAKVNITPSTHLLPWMFGLMDRHYCKVHDELFLRVLAFQSGEAKALIIVYDLDKAPNPEEWMQRIEDETSVSADNILYLANHTHTAPLTGYRPAEGPNFIGRKAPEVQEKVKEYETCLLDRLLAAVHTALQELAPARFGYARGNCGIGVNRCVQYEIKGEDGTTNSIMGLGCNIDGLADHTLLALRVENIETGRPIGFFTNYAVHCVASFLNDCGDGKSFLSGDIGGAVSRALEEEYPGSVALWTSAPAGDINPVQMVQTFHPDLKTGAPVERCVLGEDAADAAINAMAGWQLASIRQALKKVVCNIDRGVIRAKIDWAKTQCSKSGITGGEQICNEDYTIRTHLLQIGPLALIGVDGELYTSFGLAMKAVSPVADTFIINHDASLLPNNPGYIADDASIQRIKDCGGWGSLPGGRVYTAPGTVKAAMEESTKRLFQ